MARRTVEEVAQERIQRATTELLPLMDDIFNYGRFDVLGSDFQVRGPLVGFGGHGLAGRVLGNEYSSSNRYSLYFRGNLVLSAVDRVVCAYRPGQWEAQLAEVWQRERGKLVRELRLAEAADLRDRFGITEDDLAG